MKIFVSLLLVFSFIFSQSAEARKRRPKKKVPEYKPITVELISFPGIPQRFLEARVNGSTKRLFLMDTSASENTIFDWYAEELRLPTLLAEPSKPGDEPIHHVKVASLKIGTLERKEIPAAVVKSPPVFKKLQVAGIISPQNFLKDKTFTIDFKQNLIVIESRLKKQQRVALPLIDCGEKKKFAIRSDVNDNQGVFELSTGLSQSAVEPELAEKAKLSRSLSDKPQTLSREKILLGKKAFGSVKFQLTKKDEEGLCRSEGKLAMDFLEGLRLTFSKDRKILVVER